MKIKQDVEKLLQKDMDRRSFLKHVGIGFAAIVGVSAMLKTLSNVATPESEKSLGYGAGVYGGRATDASAKPAPARVQG